MIRSGGFKLIVYPRAKVMRLYDMLRSRRQKYGQGKTRKINDKLGDRLFQPYIAAYDESYTWWDVVRR